MCLVYAAKPQQTPPKWPREIARGAREAILPGRKGPYKKMGEGYLSATPAPV